MLSTLAAVSIVLNAVSGSGSGDWTYDDQAAWSNLANSKCASTYTTQSPININTQNTITCPSSNKLTWNTADISSFIVTNEESHHNLKVVPQGSAPFATLTNNFGGEHSQYLLDSFHIHWQSEHTINNAQSELEIHFVHYSSKYSNIVQALSASTSDPYVLAVVAVLFDTGSENNFLKQITDSITSLRSSGQSIRITGVKISDLLPNSISGADSEDEDEDNNSGAFYHYKGSLTTPTCDPVVAWHVLKEKMTLSAAQLTAIRSNILDASNNAIDKNFRDIQTNTNDVYLCPASSEDD